MLALRLKPIFEARAKAMQHEGVNQYSLSPKSDEASPIRTDETVASLANISSNTIRKIERIEASAGTLVFVAGEPQNCKIFFATLFLTKTITESSLKFAEVRSSSPNTNNFKKGLTLSIWCFVKKQPYI